jgi:hypothetical protein
MQAMNLNAFSSSQSGKTSVAHDEWKACTVDESDTRFAFSTISGRNWFYEKYGCAAKLG